MVNIPPDIQSTFWLVLIANIPLVIAFAYALQKKWVVMGSTHKDALIEKDREIAFRESLRQEALTDKRLTEQTEKEKVETIKGLSNVIQQSVVLTERILSDREPNAKPRRARPRTSSSSRRNIGNDS